MEDCINKCTPYEYENHLSPKPAESDLVQVYDSIEQITNPNSNHIYVVGNDVYVFDGVSFVSISGCDIPVYTGDYTVTAPSTDDLVLPTKDKLMEDDVTIKANYEIEDALIQNTAMDEYVNDRVTKIEGNYRFGECMIKKVILPNVTQITNSHYVFEGQSVSLVEEIHLPRWTTGGGYAMFDNNPNLRLIDYGFQILSYMRNCPNLNTLIVRRTTIQTLVTHNSWSGTPFSPDDGTGGYVYVPQSLISAYQSDASWQQHMNVLEFRPIEGSEYEIEGLESTNNLSQSFSLNSPLNETFDTPLEDEFIPTEELESEE